MKAFFVTWGIIILSVVFFILNLNLVSADDETYCPLGFKGPLPITLAWDNSPDQIPLSYRIYQKIYSITRQNNDWVLGESHDMVYDQGRNLNVIPISPRSSKAVVTSYSGPNEFYAVAVTGEGVESPPSNTVKIDGQLNLQQYTETVLIDPEGDPLDPANWRMGAFYVVFTVYDEFFNTISGFALEESSDLVTWTRINVPMQNTQITNAGNGLRLIKYKMDFVPNCNRFYRTARNF